MRVLVTGGVRSGKSAHAEALLADRPAVTYVAPGPTGEDDPEWARRIAVHQQRRPAHWTTVETSDLRAPMPDGPILLDCLGTWLTAQLDDLGWNPAELDPRIDGMVEVLAGRSDLVVVTNEVGLGVVPAHASGRLFRDLLGTVNQRVAAICDEVHLVIAGRVLVL